MTGRDPERPGPPRSPPPAPERHPQDAVPTAADDWDSRFDITAKLPRSARDRRAEPCRAVVRVVAGPDLLAFVALSPRVPVTLGRDELADLPLSDASVSRNHARIELLGDDEVMVTDLGSTNGTRIDGRAIGRALLPPGAQLELGSVTLRLDTIPQSEIEHLARVRARLRRAEGRDPLTGLLTRSFLEDELPRIAAACAQADLPLCCLFFDLDHFKAINDGLGHAAGDQILVGVARLTMLHCRDVDACVRYGGEEFVVIMQGTGAAAAADTARRLCRVIQGHDWSRAAPERAITISCGVAQRRVNEDLGAWIGRADRAMYVAKREGRNRVARATGD